MVLARMAIWKFKRGQRVKGFAILEDSVTAEARKKPGFRGNLTLLSTENSQSGVIITLWSNEASEKIYAEELFEITKKKLKQFVIGQPEIKYYRVFNAELRH